MSVTKVAFALLFSMASGFDATTIIEDWKVVTNE